MDYTKKTRSELIALCKEQNIKGYSDKKKEEIIGLLQAPLPSASASTSTSSSIASPSIASPSIASPSIASPSIASPSIASLIPSLTVADFFCGAGGFSEGFYQTGFDVVFALDYWKPAYITHEHNHKHCLNLCMNILEIDTPEKMDKIIPDTDIIIGSPPCISFSSSNLSGKADKTLGLQLIQHYLKIIHYKKNKANSKLKYWIMENVPNSIDYIKDRYTAAELGFADSSLPDLIINNKHILVASDYGSPQGRKRAIVGDYILPEKTHTPSNAVHILKILEGLGTPLNNPKQTITDPSFPELSVTKSDLTDHFYDSEIPSDWANKAKRLKVDHGFMGRMDFPDRTDRLCRTIMATESYCSRESIIFPKEGYLTKYRAPTIRELACLMGFPIDYQFIGTNSTSKHKQIGNAVCVHLSMALAKAIKQDMQLELIKKPRILVKGHVNLNDLQVSIFSHYKTNPKKMNSKFHIHVPYLKMNQLRVELDNITSDFDKSLFVWRSLLHKGSGKKASSTPFENAALVKLLSSHTHFSVINQFIAEKIKPYMYDSYQFQEKNCNIATADNEMHYSPENLLQIISNKIKELDINEETIEVGELDVLFKCGKKNTYPMQILYALYILNAAVAAL
jgi:DNA (cytosine-5)-methyltransferase 1